METGFNSSPVTKGVLFRAVKPVAAAIREKIKPTAVAARREDKMEYLLQRALELGAEKAKIIDPETVVVAEWVRWKCQYGCPLFEKDPFHPPLAPDAESMKKVLKEYTKAILLNGSNGQTLSEAAVRLEGEAYNQGLLQGLRPCGPGAQRRGCLLPHRAESHSGSHLTHRGDPGSGGACEGRGGQADRAKPRRWLTLRADRGSG